MSKLRKPVTAMCIQCIYDPKAGGTWRHQVEMCTNRDCPLYQVRPVTIASAKKARAKDVS